MPAGAYPETPANNGSRFAAIRSAAVALAVTALFAGPITVAPAAAQESSYSAWQPPVTLDDELKTMLDELTVLIDKAKKSDAANPAFLSDLNDLLASYRNPWGTQLFFDDFADRNYNQNPVWKVSAGEFKVSPNGPHRGLVSKIVSQGTQTNQNITIGNIVIGTIGSGQTGAGGHAAIYTPVRISNAFRVEMIFTSKERYGRWDFGPYQGTTGNVAYRLAYIPNANPALQLQRVTSQGTTVIASYKNVLSLEGNSEHVLVWTRDRNGLMHVAVDGKQLIAVTDSGINQPFDGFMMVNSGGTYSLRSIAINGRALPNPS
ncbi:MAG: hypothetical protein WD711_12000 [Dongiaceae bacterium]